ncbi:MAG TPA: TerC family protein [Ignavibacteria bacterium]|nr:TerC family protein [Ignavibacteria bacterium]
MDEKTLYWVLFNVFVLLMLALDLGVFNRKAHEVKMKEALIWSGVWIALALLFNLGLYYFYAPPEGYTRADSALQFLTGYVIEKSLSVDNIFVFVLIFTFFKVPAIYQHKVLFWGILGALIMRAIFIFAGVALINKFAWIIYVFGAFLVFTGIKLAFQKDKEIHPERNPVLKLFKRFFRVTDTYDGGKFFSEQNSKKVATPLFVVLVLVETTDLIFAVDSIPAILAVTQDPFIVYSSNVFAILGLRSLYFALAGLVKLFVYLHYGLAAILVLVGAKMILNHYFAAKIISTELSLILIVLILASSVAASVFKNRKDRLDQASRLS